MKFGELIKAEDYFLRAKQATEVFKEDNTPLWENYPEWQILRLSILQNLSSVYKLAKKEKLAYELLKTSSKVIKSSLFLENSDLILSGLDLFFLDLARFSYKQKDYSETIFNSDIAISFIRGILRNSNVLNDLQLKFKVMRKNFEEFLMKKNVTLGFLLFLKGKSQAHLQLNEESQLNLIQAYNIGKAYQGENDILTKKYSTALMKLNTKVIKTLPTESIDNLNIKLDESFEGEDMEGITPLLDENNEILNTSLKPQHQSRQRRSSIFKNQSAVSFFDRKVVKHCGCIDVHEAHMAKIDYDSQKILNQFRSHDPECKDCGGHPNNTEGGGGHSHHESGGEHNHGHNHGGGQEHGHGGHGHGQQEEFFQSFCSTIINKSLNITNKNRHLNNHDLKKIYMQSEQNLKKMKLIVDNYSKPSQSLKRPHKVNILYSPNHFKILENTSFSKRESNINLSFLQEKKPSIFQLLTPKTPYSKRIPFSRPFTSRNQAIKPLENPLININIGSQELLNLIKNTPKAQMFMSSRPLSCKINSKYNEESKENEGFLTKRKMTNQPLKTEDCIIHGRQSIPSIRHEKKLLATKSNEDNNNLMLKESPLFRRKDKIAKTFKMEASSPVTRADLLSTFNTSKNFRRASEAMNNKGFLDITSRNSKFVDLQQLQVSEIESEDSKEGENHQNEDNNKDITEKSDSSSGKNSILIAKDTESAIKNFETRINTPKLTFRTDKIEKVFDFKEQPENEAETQDNKPMSNNNLEVMVSDENEEFGEKLLLKKKIAAKLIHEIFKNILLHKLKKKNIVNSQPFAIESHNNLKKSSQSPIHYKELALFTDSNSSIQKISNMSIDKKALTFICYESFYFLAKDLLFNRQILWQLVGIQLFVNDEVEEKNDKTSFFLKLYLTNSIEKGVTLLRFTISAIINEELRDLRLLNEVWRQYITKKKTLKLVNIDPTMNSESGDMNNMGFFLDKLAGYLQNCLFLKDKIIGNSWCFLEDNTERFLKTKQNYELYRQYLHETLIDRDESFDFYTKMNQNSKEIPSYEIHNQNSKEIPNNPKNPNNNSNNQSNYSKLQISLKNSSINNSYAIGEVPTPFSLKSLQPQRKEQVIIPKCLSSYRGSQDFSSKVAFFENRKSLFQSNSFKNSFPRRESHFRKNSIDEKELDMSNQDTIEYLDSVEENLPKQKSKEGPRPFIREFYAKFIEKWVICMVLIRGNQGFEMEKLNFINNHEENVNLFVCLNSEEFFEGLVRNAKVEIQRIFIGNGKVKEQKTLGLKEFIELYMGKNEFMKKIEFLLYNFRFKQSDLLTLISGISGNGLGKRKSPNKKKVFYEKTPKLLLKLDDNIRKTVNKTNDNKKKILMKFMKKFLKITEDNQGFQCFIYDPLSRNTNNYIYLEKNYANLHIFPHISNKKSLEFVWNSLIKQKSSFLGKKPTLKRENLGFSKKTRIFTQYNIYPIGKCYIIIDLSIKNQGFLLEFSIMPFFTKFKKYHFMLNSEEIKTFFKIERKSENSMNFVESFLENQMRTILDDCQNYYFRALCLDRGLLYNEIRLLVNKEKYLKNHRVYSKGIETIGQFLMKIDGFMHIFSIQRDSLLDKINILMYSCKTTRTFQCSVNKEDYENLLGSFMVFKRN